MLLQIRNLGLIRAAPNRTQIPPTHPISESPGSPRQPAIGPLKIPLPSPMPQTPLTFAAFQKLIYDRYYPTDSARGTPGTFMWLMEEVGELATALQNNAPGKSPTPQERANLDEEFADVLAWLTTIANIHAVDLEKALRKYTHQTIEGVKD